MYMALIVIFSVHLILSPGITTIFQKMNDISVTIMFQN